MNAVILDTETNTLQGLPIEIAYVPVVLKNSEVSMFADRCFDEYYSVGEAISYAAMAVHHILESDIADKPSYKTFVLPDTVQYIIGHNIDYDIAAIQRCGVDTSNIKAICTLALARKAWPNADAHNISALIYMLMSGNEMARQKLRDAHNAKADVLMTGFILKSIVRALGVKTMDELYIASEAARIPEIMTFGKHKGVAIRLLPADYKAWLLKQSELDPYLRKALVAA